MPETCTICHQTYAKSHKDLIIAKLPSINLSSDNKCLTCYQAELKQHIASLTPKLQELYPALEAAKKTYNDLYAEWRKVADLHNAYDNQNKRIMYETNQLELKTYKANKKAQTNKSKNPPKSKQPTKQKTLIMQLFASLTEQQRTDLLSKLATNK